MDLSLCPQSKYHRAAICYATRFHFPVFPVKHDKTPLTAHGFKDATCDLNQIELWWAEHPEAGVGIPTGKASGLYVVDFDDKPHLSSFDARHDFEREFGKLPDTPTVLTGGGGFHEYFFSERELPCRTSMRPNTDFRGEGGFIVAPPSMHKSGKRYEWEAVYHLRNMPIAFAPAWLETLVLGKTANLSGRGSTDWLKFFREPICAGRRNASMASIVGHLHRKYVDVEIVKVAALAINKSRLRPPLDDREVLAVCDSVLKTELRRREAKHE